MVKHATSIAVFASLLFASGCLIESNINADGGGTLRLSTYVPKQSKLEDMKKQMMGSDVKLKDAKMEGNNATFDLEFKDFTKISTAPYFKNTKITRTVDAEKGTTTIKAVVKHDKKAKVPESLKKLYNDEVKIVTTVPGEITDTNAGKKEGKTATWTYTFDEFYGVLEVPLHLTYKNPS